MKNIKRDVELIFEVSAFRRLDRAWKQFLGPDVANNSEHTFRVAWIALIIAGHEKNVNMEKLLKMALVHDLPESRCGDTHYLSRQYVKQNESLAMDDIFSDTIHESEMKNLMIEYKERKTIESKIIKDADNIDANIELKEFESKGEVLAKIWREDRQKKVYPKLYTETARLLWDKIDVSEPYEWHSNSDRNRFQSGDWKN